MSLRESKKQRTRRSILSKANERFVRDGYEETTLEDICDAVGISKRTFFRYFPNKEALVFPNHEERLAVFLGFLQSAPTDESNFDTLRRATQAFAMDYTQNRDRFVGQYKLIRTSTSLQAREHEIDREWERVMALWLAGRIDACDSESVVGEDALPQTPEETMLHAKILAGASIGVIRATMRHWYESDGVEDLAKLGHSAIARLERGFFG